MRTYKNYNKFKMHVLLLELKVFEISISCYTDCWGNSRHWWKLYFKTVKTWRVVQQIYRVAERMTGREPVPEHWGACALTEEIRPQAESRTATQMNKRSSKFVD